MDILCLDTSRCGRISLRTNNPITNRADVGSTWTERTALARTRLLCYCTTLCRHLGAKLPLACNVRGVVTAHETSLFEKDVGVKAFTITSGVDDWRGGTATKPTTVWGNVSTLNPACVLRVSTQDDQACLCL